MPAPHSRGPAITDVARLAGVSHQTVSRVVNDKREVSPATRDRVLTAIEQLGYRPNRAARSLAGGRSRTLGVVSLNGTLYGVASMFTSIQHAAMGRGYSVAASNVHSFDRAAVEQAIRQLTDRNVEGIVMITPLVSLAPILADLPTRLPIVAVEGGLDCSFNVVSSGQYAAAYAATRHLLDCGHRTVWHVAGPSDWWEARQRAEGWRDAVLETGERPPPVLDGDWSARSGYVAGTTLAADLSVTAVFVGNDSMALGLLRALHENGRRVPEDVSVVGFDDIPEAAYLSPPLTTVRQDFAEVGQRSVGLLLDQVEGITRDVAPRRLNIPSQLVFRESTSRASSVD